MQSFKGDPNEDTFWRAGKVIEEQDELIQKHRSKEWEYQRALNDIIRELGGIDVNWEYKDPKDVAKIAIRQINGIKEKYEKE